MPSATPDVTPTAGSNAVVDRRRRRIRPDKTTAIVAASHIGLRHQLLGTAAFAVAALLSTATPAFADGGAGGGSSIVGGGGTAGTDSTSPGFGGNGGNGSNGGVNGGGGGGGGGAGISGGQGGTGGTGQDTGGGGTIGGGGSPSGGNGGPGGGGGDGGGGGGGGGGGHAIVNFPLPPPSISLTAGSGGTGGAGAQADIGDFGSGGGGGGGGGGGYGVVITTSTSTPVDIQFNASGGGGGNGGTGGHTQGPNTFGGNGGNGGDGGHGMAVTGSTGGINLQSNIAGGTGGNGGQGGSSSGIGSTNGFNGNGGNGGIGLLVTTTNQVTVGVSSAISGGGGGGGNGGGNGGDGVSLSGSGSNLVNNGMIVGGNGGGASGTVGPGTDGGNGGNGVSVTGTGATLTNNNTIRGGAGGSGVNGGNGAGGIGVLLSNGTLINTGSIYGASISESPAIFGAAGNGVQLGSGTVINTGQIFGGNGGSASGTGVAILNGGTLINNGTITGGTLDGFGTQVAVTFGSGTNTLELWSSSIINGSVIATTGGTDTLAVGGAANGTFDVSQIGQQYQGFGIFEKTGTSTWTLTGNGAYTINTIVSAGTLNVAGSLGQTEVTVAGGATLTNSGSGSIAGPVTVQGGGTLSGVAGTTFSMGALTLQAGAITDVLINGSGFVPFNVGGNLTVAGTLNIASTGGYGPGVYHVIEYGGTFTNNGLVIGSQPAGFTAVLNTATAQQLNITVYDGPTSTQFWQGGATPVGGSGIWSSNNPVWLNADSSQSTIWGGVQGIFHGTPGTVTVDGTQAFQSLEFVVDGYALVAGNGGALTPTGMARLWAEGARTTATIATPITGAGGIVKIGAGTIVLAAANSYAGGTTIERGTLSISTDANLGAASGGIAFNGGTLENTAALTTARSVTLTSTGTFRTTADLTATGIISGPGALAKSGAGRLTLTGTNTYSGGTIIHDGIVSVSADANLGAASGGLIFNGGTLHNTAAVTTARAVTLNAGGAFHTTADLALSGVVSGPGTLIKSGEHRLTLSGNNAYSGGTIINAGTLRIGDGGTSGSIQGNVVNNGLLAFDRSDTVTYGGAVSGSGGLAKFGANTLILTGNSSYAGGTTINAGTLQIGNGGTGGSIMGNITNNGTLAIDRAGNLVLAGAIAGSGALAKSGSGTLMLGGINSYAGGTSVTQGSLAISSDNNLGAPSGGLTLNGGGLLATESFSTARAITLGPAGGHFHTPGGITLSASGVLSGPGALTLAGGGTLSLGGINSYTGTTTVEAGSLVVNGSIASSSFLSVDPSGSVGGTGTLPSTAINGGLLAPGNSIGTMTVQGTFAQNGGTYQVELSPTAADRTNITGSAIINGGTVQILASSGSYANNTTYTIVNATGGVTGAYSDLTEDFAFLTPTLAYDANNVFLTLALMPGAFSFGGNTPNEKAVGYALDRSFANATGDFATVIGALAGLSTSQGPLALNAISGQPWANFGTMNVATGAMFMNTVGQQMALARGGAAGGQRVALAGACDVAACDGPGPWSAWLSAVGGLGSVHGNRNASTFTYNAGGAAAGLDYRFDPRFLVGLSVGYTHGTQWTNGFMGQGWSDTVSAAVYGSFTQAGFYVDALAGFAWSTNQLQRQIVIPNLQPRTANGSTGASQFLGQAEAGYRIGIYAPAQASLTPFARLAVQSVTQYAFSESGANSLGLDVAQQGTNSLRSTIGAELAGELPLGSESKLALALRLGWLHEFDDTSRPISAAFAGAPGNSFTVYGATPARDSAVLGFQASTNVADATSIYLRYDGEVGSGTDNHAINLGLRVSW